MATQSVPVNDMSFEAAADAQLATLVQQATAEPVASPPPTTQEPVLPTPSVETTPVVAPVEAAQPVAEPPSVPSVSPLDLSKLTPEQRKDYDDAVAKEGDPARVFSRYWELHNRLSRIARGEEPAPGTKPPEPKPEPIAAPPQEVLQTEVRDRLFSDPEVRQWSTAYGTNKAKLGGLLKVDPGLDKPVFEGAVDSAYNRLEFEIARLEANLQEPYIKENPDLELGTRQSLINLRASQMEIDRLRMQNFHLDSRYAEKAKSYERSVSSARQQEFETRQAVTRQEQEIESYAQRFDRAWPGHLANVAKLNNIEDDIKSAFDLKAKYEILGMLNRQEVIDDSNLPQVLDKIAKDYMKEVDGHHRYMSRVHALKAQQTAEQPIIVPPNAASQDTNKKPIMSVQELEASYDALLRRTLGDAQLR